MSAKEIADAADMIVAGYAYRKVGDYIEVIDINNIQNRAVIQNNQVVESLMSDEEDDVVLKYYALNKELLEDSVNA